MRSAQIQRQQTGGCQAERQAERQPDAYKSMRTEDFPCPKMMIVRQNAKNGAFYVTAETS